jgi:2-polyprenyl-3-methyl-5-hydroxy-6-metoxy-1,4-benzoquinol methylase
MRNLDNEYQPNSARDYQYDFDLIVRNRLLRRWQQFFLPTGAALEMGSFDGSMTELLIRETPNLSVVEGSESLAKEVQQRFGEAITVHHGFFETFKPNQRFDQIFLVHALEHVDDPIEVLALAKSWLTEGGKLFIAVPNAYALSRQIAVKMGIVESPESVTDGERQHGHLRTYGMKSLLNDISVSGLSVVTSGGVVLKPLSNSQFDRAMKEGIVSDQYVDACDDLSLVWPEFSSSIYVVASR